MVPITSVAGPASARLIARGLIMCGTAGWVERPRSHHAGSVAETRNVAMTWRVWLCVPGRNAYLRRTSVGADVAPSREPEDIREPAVHDLPLTTARL